ncbi:MAG: hypothetical protein QOG89_2664 [Thermomicrobiales bacterium]|nr:hypothetical protein [Thermomicrobiales bacterium]
MYQAKSSRPPLDVHTSSPLHPVRPRHPLPSLRRAADDTIRAGARILIIAGVGAIAALPFVVTAAIG